MRVAGGKKFGFGEWAFIVVLVVLAVAISELVGVRQKWEHAVVYTVLVFTVVIVALRPAWGRSAFWKTLVPIFLLHVLAIVTIEQSLPPESEGPHGLPLTAVGMAEGVFIASVLWKRSMRSNSHTS